MNPDPSVTLVALIVGDRSNLLDQAERLLFDLQYYAERHPEVAVHVVVDGAAWGSALAQTLLNIPAIQSTLYETESHHPGVLIGTILNKLGTPLMSIVSIGTEVSTWFANAAALTSSAKNESVAITAGYRGSGEARGLANESYLVSPEDAFSSDYPHAWLQMLDLVPYANCIVSVAWLRSLGGFSDAPQMQRAWWWDYCLRASAHASISTLPLQPVNARSWHRLPFGVDTAVSAATYLAVAMRVYADNTRKQPVRAIEFDEIEFETQRLSSISPIWSSLEPSIQARLANAISGRRHPLRIAVVGGVNEPAHNQLGFFNFFAQMRNWGAVNWRAVLDERATAEDLAGCDLVIFSRVRNANGVALMQACVSRRIRTLYMLDDNWFWLGRELAEYAPIFSPGAEPYENFLALVRQADVVLTCRDPLADDLRPHAKRVLIMPPNVDLSVFATRPSPPKLSRRKKIGYVGSLRKNTVAFEALVGIVQSRHDVDVFVMSNSLPDEFAMLPPERVHFEPYQFNYAAYAATVVAAAPDVLVAPVGRTRFEASKCPNKYLEISAAGAVGVYSNAEPYTSYVRDGVTGLFADDSVESWTAAIVRLLDDSALHERISSAARAHVSAEFDTTAVLPHFTAVLLEAIGE